MEKDTITAIVTVLLAIVGVAILAELVSSKANTGKLLTTGGGVFSKMLCVALSPVYDCSGVQTDVQSTIHYGGF